MPIIRLFPVEYAFVVGEIVMYRQFDEVCIATHCCARQWSTFNRDTVLSCVQCINATWAVYKFRNRYKITLHDLGLKYNQRETDIMFNCDYRHIHDRNSVEIGSRKVERIMRSILDKLW